MYRVSEFSEMTGLSKETLRYYAEVKLLEPVYIDPKNKYRYYDNGSYLIAMILVSLRKFNFTIQEMLTVIEDESFENLEHILNQKKKDIQNKIKNLNSTIDEIDQFLKWGKEGDDNADMERREDDTSKY
ncbi:transcriptional regulator [Fictibacillus phosphorivorans]|uniref:Transcriptional regulator n=2 Tax=Fictibacillus phosphorivorans TaxID=1221500 RepID=A0A163RTK9_9BACL|nr:transcriptional regulator [Fictibacillus phosphorivorans]